MIRPFHLLTAFALGLAAVSVACSPVETLAPTPSEVANRTALDEQAVIGLELAYQASVAYGELALDAGVLKGERAAQVAALDARAYQALLIARAAYDTGNAATYDSALRNGREAVAEALLLLKGAPR